MLWFNPPYSQIVETNVGSKFLFLIDKHFKNKPLGKYFNRKNVKVSYSCLPNVESIISSHNKKILLPGDGTKNVKKCNCQGDNICPLNGNCRQSSVIYKATLQSDTETSIYIGQAGQTFKERFYNHNQSFNNRAYGNRTSLSKEIWKIKDKKEKYNLTWAIISKAPTYNPSLKFCHLCNLEKTFILTSNENLLNRRSELLCKCRHRQKYLLSEIK